jgi:hypothetical protein
MRRKNCTYNKAHGAHEWSADDLSENEPFRCAGIRPLVAGDVVYLWPSKKYRVAEVDDGVAILAQRGVVRARHLIAHLEWDRVAGMWRQPKAVS